MNRHRWLSLVLVLVPVTGSLTPGGSAGHPVPHPGASTGTASVQPLVVASPERQAGAPAAPSPSRLPLPLPLPSPSPWPSPSPSSSSSSSPPDVGLLASTLLGLRANPAAGDRSRTAEWGWPLVGTPEIVRGFDPPAQRWLPGHRGIDLAGVAGEAVLAVDDGVVTYSGVIAGVGMVSVTHESGLRSTYQPVLDRSERGDRVARGAVIGSLDVGGHCLARDCLHLGAVRGRDGYVDPTPLLLGAELTLLPVGP